MRRVLNHFFLLFAVISCLSAQSRSGPGVVISEVMHNNTPHFKIETSSATYFIEKQSGGCSSLLDSGGHDWISFRLTGNDGPTLSSDSDYRGLPNLVHQGPLGFCRPGNVDTAGMTVAQGGDQLFSEMRMLFSTEL